MCSSAEVFAEVLGDDSQPANFVGQPPIDGDEAARGLQAGRGRGSPISCRWGALLLVSSIVFPGVSCHAKPGVRLVEFNSKPGVERLQAWLDRLARAERVLVLTIVGAGQTKKVVTNQGRGS